MKVSDLKEKSSGLPSEVSKAEGKVELKDAKAESVKTPLAASVPAPKPPPPAKAGVADMDHEYGDFTDPKWRSSKVGKAAYAKFLRTADSYRDPPPPEI